MLSILHLLQFVVVIFPQLPNMGSLFIFVKYTENIFKQIKYTDNNFQKNRFKSRTRTMQIVENQKTLIVIDGCSMTVNILIICDQTK